jgi:hypothetical protein
MEEVLTLAQKIATISFPVLMVVILIGSYWETWVWGRQLRECKAECAARLTASERDRDEWKAMALSATGLAETSLSITNRRGGSKP